MNVMMLSALTFVFAGSCAASNGGGHTVGNSIISESASKSMTATNTDTSCACAKAKDTKAAKTCKCPSEATGTK